MTRILPDIPRIKAHWGKHSSDIPEYLMVPMSDGRTVKFIPDEPHPGFVKAMKIIERMEVGGASD